MNQLTARLICAGKEMLNIGDMEGRVACKVNDLLIGCLAINFDHVDYRTQVSNTLELDEPALKYASQLRVQSECGFGQSSKGISFLKQ